MLHGCAFPGCTTLTLSTYCVEHELLIRAAKESEHAHRSESDVAPALGDDPSLEIAAVAVDPNLDVATTGSTD